MLHMIKSLRYNNGLLQKKNPFKKEWGSAAASREAHGGEPYRETTAENPPRPAGKKKTPNPVYTTGDPANTRAALLTILAVLWLTLCLLILPKG